MNSLTLKKMATGFALLSFGILAVGSLLTGARLFTSFVRGIEAGVIFGLLAWGLGSFLVEEEEGLEADAEAPDDEQKGQNLETAV